MNTNARKRQRNDDDNERDYSSTSKIDPTTGQRGAFPGLDGEDGEDQESIDALSYLRSVRKEALGVPNLLVAVSSHLKVRDSDDFDNGFYEDGAYAAYAAESDEGAGELESIADEAQNAYHASLLARFDRLRRQMEIKPATPVESTSSFATALKIRNSKWTHALKMQQPRPAHFVSLSREQVDVSLHRIETLIPSLAASSDEVISNVAAWTWSLLAKCRGMDEMSSEEVCTLRSLAKKASQVLGYAELNDDQEDVVQEDFHDDDADEFRDETAHAGEQVSKSEQDFEPHKTSANEPLREKQDDLLKVVNENTEILDSNPGIQDSDKETHFAGQHANRPSIIAFLDMILTIVGERYGQKDLLIYRSRWSETEAEDLATIA